MLGCGLISFILYWMDDYLTYYSLLQKDPPKKDITLVCLCIYVWVCVKWAWGFQNGPLSTPF